MNAEGGEVTAHPAPGEDPFDRWVLSRLDGLVATVTSAIDGHRPSEAVRAMYDFTWKELADWYLEAAKPRFRLDPTDPARQHAVSVATHTLDVVVRLLHPFMPFVTQAISDLLPGGGTPLIARTAEPTWPTTKGIRDEPLEQSMAAFFELVRRARDARKELGLGERDRVAATLRQTGSADSFVLSPEAAAALGLLARVDVIDDLTGDGGWVVVGDGVELTVAAPAAGAASDKGSLVKEQEATKANIDKLEQQLGNANFVSKAKPEVVQRARDQLEAALEKRAALEEAIARA